jgi:RNA polymerase sigma-70 factor, ECF subfamily
MDQETDEVLMRRYCAGDERAFEALFARHAGRVHAFLVRHVRDRALADDLLQSAWLHVHRARGTFRDGERFTAWLYTIANNLRRDEGRRRARDQAALSRDGKLPEPSAAASAAAGGIGGGGGGGAAGAAGGGGSGAAGGGELAERVAAALEALPEQYREVIVLHRWHDLGFAEIARMLGTTEGAVKLRAHRGYLALREALGKEAP